jgi:hypothetical protein
LDKIYKECKCFIVRGLLSLLGGSLLLFVVKLPGLPEFLGTLSSVAGGVILLYGNWCIIYGLLIFAGNQEAE